MSGRNPLLALLPIIYIEIIERPRVTDVYISDTSTPRCSLRAVLLVTNRRNVFQIIFVIYQEGGCREW